MGPLAYPKITIVCTCHNRANYIGETIESVINQGYPNLECIVIDDNSSDGSWDVIQTYKDRLAYCERLTEEHDTPVPAINYALSKSTGEFMTTLNDKNLLLPKSLFTAAAVFTAFPDVEWFTGINLTADHLGRITSVMPIRKDVWEHVIGVRWNLQHESTFWRRSLWERTGGRFDDAYPWAFDAGLWSKFFPEARLYFLNTVIGAYRKLPTAHGTVRRSEYHEYATRARRQLRESLPKKEIAYAQLYRVLSYAKPLLRNIPDSVWARIPILSHLSNESIEFSDANTEPAKFRCYKRNPFRMIYPR